MDPSAVPPHRVSESLERLEHRLSELSASMGAVERAVGQRAAGQARGAGAPAWRRVTDTEQRLPVTLAIIAMILLQSRVPERLSLLSWWVLPAIEALILCALVASNPRRIDQSSQRLRALSLLLVTLASFANAWAAGSLILGLVHGTEGKNAADLLMIGGNIWLTNIVVFAVWYWELDRGGPAARAAAVHDRVDFLFPQMTTPDLSGDWEPELADYLYLAFTNATAFSPTDTLPLSRWSKMAMMLQSAISLAVGALIVARAVNILG
jgi:uncharacterized membrane protein